MVKEGRRVGSGERIRIGKEQKSKTKPLVNTSVKKQMYSWEMYLYVFIRIVFMTNLNSSIAQTQA